MTDTHTQQILRERAVALAREPEQPRQQSELIEALTFRLAGEVYAIETKYVREVIGKSDVTPVPGTPAFLTGVTNLRGEILAVMNLAGFLSGETQDARSPWLLVLGTDRSEFGAAADDVSEVVTFRSDEILECAGSAVGVADAAWVRGVTDSAVVVLDGRAILNDERLQIEED